MILMITNQKAKDQIIFRVSTEALKIQLQNPDIDNQKGVGGGKIFDRFNTVHRVPRKVITFVVECRRNS